MKARFTGDAKGNGPEAMSAFGLYFPKGRWVSIDSVDETVQLKLMGNFHFDVEDGEAPVIEAPAESGSSGSDIPPDWKSAHHSKRKSWAGKLAGKKVTSLEEADRLIEQHLDEDDFTDLDPD